MKAYEVIYGDWEEQVMVVLANSREETRTIIEKLNPRLANSYVGEIANDLTKPGVIFTYNR